MIAVEILLELVAAWMLFLAVYGFWGIWADRLTASNVRSDILRCCSVAVLALGFLGLILK